MRIPFNNIAKRKMVASESPRGSYQTSQTYVKLLLVAPTPPKRQRAVAATTPQRKSNPRIFNSPVHQALGFLLLYL